MMRKFCFICLMLFLAANVGWAIALIKPHVDIPLKEIAAKPRAKSATTYAPVQVEQYAATLEVRFNSNLGNQNVVITNQWGFVVYQQLVNATAGSRLVIDTQNWAPGTYTIQILDGQGDGLEGQFVK